jgi:hypothetical protein
MDHLAVFMGFFRSEKFFGSLLVGRDSNPDERMSGMETRPTKPLFIVQCVPKGYEESWRSQTHSPF